MINELEILFVAGAGGNGAVTYNLDGRAMIGRPNGGNGGKGGNIYLKCSSNVYDLSYLKFKKKIQGFRGTKGGACGSNGKKGKDIIIKIPLGTSIINSDNKNDVYNIKLDEKYLLCKGGNGGIGNGNLVNKLCPMPTYSIPAQEGESKKIILLQQIIGDIGFVGAPNVGKSSLLNKLTNSKSKVGNYNFTTIHPQIGIWKKNNKNYRLIDLPGLIAGANEGKGLGLQFLKHYSKLKKLILVLKGDGLQEQLYFLKNELQAFDLWKKIKLVIINKSDLLTNQKRKYYSFWLQKNFSVAHIYISVLKNSNLTALKKHLTKILLE